jgi:hypothetical protein
VSGTEAASHRQTAYVTKSKASVTENYNRKENIVPVRNRREQKPYDSYYETTVNKSHMTLTTKLP